MSLLLAMGLVACGPESEREPAPVVDPGGPRHVILISLDTARADFFGFMGNPWVRTPRLDSLADESVVFESHESVAPTTLASHATIFTGKFAHHHGTPANGFMVNLANEMLPEILQRAGFHTAGFAGSFALSNRFDFAQGFDHYDEAYQIRKGDQHSDQSHRDARAVTDAAIAHVGALADAGMPERVFLFVHYFDPHRPYLDQEGFGAMYQRAPVEIEVGDIDEAWKQREQWGRHQARRYAAEISYMDHHIGRLLLALLSRGLLDEAIVVVTSDHGENFLEHPRIFNHGLTVYGTTTRALWTMRLPGREQAGRRVESPTSSIDVLPTLLSELGLEPPPGVDGRVIALRGAESGLDRPTFSQATKPRRLHREDPRWANMPMARSIRRGPYKLVQTPTTGAVELYRLDRDPLELNDLLREPTPEIAEQAAAMRAELEAWAASADPLPTRFQGDDDHETVERLKSLGYLED